MSDDVSVGRRVAWMLGDTAWMTWRNLMAYVRVPYLIFFAIVQPIIFALLFVYVFGGAIATPNGRYVDYVLPGIILQTAIFSSMYSGINIADDIQKGIMDRFRSLPIGRGTVLAARTLSDTVRNATGTIIMIGVGYAVGYRFHGTVLGALSALGLIVLMGFAFSWIAATIGVLVRNTQTAELAGFTWVFPLVFVSSIFVPVATMPGWLRGIATYNPISLGADAVRAYSFGQPAGLGALWTVLLSVGIVLVFRSIAVSRFRRLG